MSQSPPPPGARTAALSSVGLLPEFLYTRTCLRRSRRRNRHRMLCPRVSAFLSSFTPSRRSFHVAMDGGPPFNSCIVFHCADSPGLLLLTQLSGRTLQTHHWIVSRTTPRTELFGLKGEIHCYTATSFSHPSIHPSIQCLPTMCQALSGVQRARGPGLVLASDSVCSMGSAARGPCPLEPILTPHGSRLTVTPGLKC